MADVSSFKLNCLDPVIYRYTERLDENGNIIRKPTIMYPCGKCIVCLEKKRRQWANRMLNESNYSKSCYFVTLTYNDENLPLVDIDMPTLDKTHYQSFLKSLRKHLKFRFYGCGEYGSESSRPHYHFILFFDTYISRNKIYDLCGKCWLKGFVTVKKATFGRMYYIAKYATKGADSPPWATKAFTTSSINPPIGYRFFEDNIHLYDSNLSENRMTSVKGFSTSIPRSFEEKLKNHLDDKMFNGSVMRKERLLFKGSCYLKDYLKKYNSISDSRIIELRQNIIDKYNKRNKKITNL